MIPLVIGAMVRIKISTELVMRAARKGMVVPLNECALEVQATARRSMKSGWRRGGRYIPSAPGQPPHRNTGELAEDITVFGTYERPGYGLGVSVGNTAKCWWSVVHEFGGRIHPPRPYLLPALRKVQHRFAARFKGCVHA